jgi:SPP1 family predicted phage head-tail adaptor
VRAGELNRRISIERRTDVNDEYGQPIPTWVRIGKIRWAKKFQMRGYERFANEQYVGREQNEFWVRWANDIDDISPEDRIVFPAQDSPPNSAIYEIMAVHEIGLREGFKILTARRSETT